MKRISLFILGLICFGVFPAMAADCPALVQQALAATDQLCHETSKNQACYGNVNLSAKPAANAQNFSFSQPGDRVSISDIKSLQLSPMTVDKGEWGVALMNVEANRPTGQAANLTVLAFGDVSLENDVQAETAMDVNVSSQSAINARIMPSVNAGVVGTLQPNQTVSAMERLGDGSWLRVKLPNQEQTGWVKSDFMSSAGDLRTLNIVDGTQPQYGPMQAFTFKSGSTGQNCSAVPQDGLIIQTPEGSGEVQLWINKVVVKLGSTVYFKAQASGDMVVTTVEGHATVEAMGVSHTAYAGSSIHIQLDADMNPAAAPSLPQAYTMADVENLPIDHLQRKITIHAPLTPQELTQQPQTPTSNGNNTTNGNSGNSNNGANNNNNGNSGNSQNCPGNSCHNGNNNNNGNGGHNQNGNAGNGNNGNNNNQGNDDSNGQGNNGNNNNQGHDDHGNHGNGNNNNQGNNGNHGNGNNGNHNGQGNGNGNHGNGNNGNHNGHGNH